jgi:hypothetical protein
MATSIMIGLMRYAFFKTNTMNETQALANLIKATLGDESVTEFAKAVAIVLGDEYGQHNYNEFIDTLQNQLK